MKKIFGFKRRKKEAPPERGASDSAVSAATATASFTVGGYEVRSKDLPKLHKAAAAGDLQKLKQLAAKRDLNQLDRCNRTPLHLACANGWTNVVTFLVGRRCNLNICDNDNCSPLMKAIQCRQELCARYLLEHGADPNLADANGNTALHLAASTSCISIAQKLIEHHARLDVHNKDGSTPLTVTVIENNQEMLEFFLQSGANIHARDNVGRTPLLFAASYGNHELVKFLLEHGADISNKDYTGWSTEDYAIFSGDATLRYKITEYADCQNTDVSPPASKKELSLRSSPGKDAGFSLDAPGDAGFSLGAPATNKEVVDYLSSGDSLRNSGKTDDDSWLSSEEEELDFSPKKPQKPSLAQLMNIARLKKEIFEKSSVNSSQQNRSDCEAEDLNESLPMSQVKSFPHPVHSSPGSFSKHSQMASRLRSEQEEEDHDEDKEAGAVSGVKEAGAVSGVLDKNFDRNANSQDQCLLHDEGITSKGKCKEEDEVTDSPWDSESPRSHVEVEATFGSSEKPLGFLLPSPAKASAHINYLSTNTTTHMRIISEEPCGGKSYGSQLKTAKTNEEHDVGVSHLLKGTETKEKPKSDIMEELGLGDADDIEDESDWDSTSVSLKSIPSNKSFNVLAMKDHSPLKQLTKQDSITKTSETIPVKRELSNAQIIASTAQQCNRQVTPKVESGKNEVDEEKRKQKKEKSEATGRGDYAETEKELAVNAVEKKKEQKLSINKQQPIQTEGNMIEDSPVNVTSSVERPELIPVSLKGTNLADSMDARESENKRRILKQRASRQFTENLHQLHDESSLSEPSLEEERKGAMNGKKKICRSSDTDELTQSSDTANTEDLELPKSVYREAVLMIDQLSLNSTDSINLLKIQNIFKGYERLIEREKGRCARLHGKVKKLEKEKKEHQSMFEEMKEMKSMLDHNKMEQEGDISALKFSLKQEEEKRMSAEILSKKNQEQLRKKEEQYCKEMEEKQQLELMLRTLEMELRTLKTHLKEAEEERNEMQRLLSQEQNARALQEGILNTHLWRQKEIEEESKKKLAQSSEMGDGHDQEKELLQKNKNLQDEVSLVRLELDQLKIQHQEVAAKYLEENEALKEKTEELKKELKINEEALTQTVFQYNGQINLSKAESGMLTSKLEHIKENKERLEVELDSFRSRLNSALQELERSQISKTDLERILQRERDDWLHLKDRLNHDLLNLKETNNAMSQQLGKAESKANTLENELHHMTHTLREKNLLLDSVQRDLTQAQGQVKELENARQVEKDQMNKYAVKQDSMQERLAQLQSENLLLRQQFEDLQNKGIIKEKVVSDVQDRFTDIFGKLRADSEKQVEMMEVRNKELITTCNNLREQVFKYETEKVERESALRQLQQELADSLKKQSMSEASLEVTTRYRNDLEEDKQQFQKEIERIKSKLQESEEQYIQSERRAYELRNALEAKEHEASMASQKLQDLLLASSGTSNTVKQLEEHIQRLEIENARLEATTKQQTGRVEILQKDLQNSTFVHNRLEELITGLQTTKIHLEEQLSHQVQKQSMLSANAQDTHNMWEEELKSRSELGVRLTEIDREKAELTSQLEYERKKMRKVLDLKRSVEVRLDQEIKRSSELQKECNGIRKLLKLAKKKIKESESDSSSPTSFKREIEDRYSEIDTEVGKLRKKVDELSYQLETESTRRTQVETANFDLREQLTSMKLLHRNHEKLEKSKLQLEEEVADLKRHIHGNLMDHKQIEQYKRDIEERARQEIRQKLEEVNLFLQKQAASQETLEQIRANNNTSLKNQLEHRIKDLECELARLKSNQQDNFFQKESTFMELERYKGLYTEELKRRKSIESKLDRANEKLAESNAKLLHERHKSSSLLANSFVSGNLSTNPVLETVQLGNLGTNLALNRGLNLGGGFINPNITTVSSKDSIEAYLAKMRVELEKSITRELQQATAELDAATVRISPIGSNDASSRNLNMSQVSKAKQDYLDVLKKTYMR